MLTNPNEDNIVLDYMAKVFEARVDNDKARFDALSEAGAAVCVTLKDVGIAFDAVLEDVTNLMDYDTELMEYRLIAIVESLDEVTKAKIKKKFEAADDDLFIEGENN